MCWFASCSCMLSTSLWCSTCLRLRPSRLPPLPPLAPLRQRRTLVSFFRWCCVSSTYHVLLHKGFGTTPHRAHKTAITLQKELRTPIKALPKLVAPKTNKTQPILSCGRRASYSRTNATEVYFGDSSMHSTHSAQRLNDIRRPGSRDIRCSKAQKSKVNSSDLARMLRLQHQHY